MKSSTSSNNWPSDVSSEENNVNKHLSYGFFCSLQPTNPQSSLPSTSLVPTQAHKSPFQHATTVLDPLLDESLPVAVLWQVCFFLDVLRASPSALVRSAMQPVTVADASH